MAGDPWQAFFDSVDQIELMGCFPDVILLDATYKVRLLHIGGTTSLAGLELEIVFQRSTYTTISPGRLFRRPVVFRLTLSLSSSRSHF